MSNRTPESEAKQATPAELHRGVREHYDRVSGIATESSSVVPRAIDLWFAQFGPSGKVERELYDSEALGKLLNERDALRAALQGMVNAFCPRVDITVAREGGKALHPSVKRALQMLGALLPDDQDSAALSANEGKVQGGEK